LESTGLFGPDDVDEDKDGGERQRDRLRREIE